MTTQTFTDGQILTAAEMNTLSTQAGGAAQTANNGSDFANPATVRSNIGAGTVNSVALTMPSGFAVAGSPVTNAGTLAVTRATQGANLIEAGPASGAAAVPTYRALVAADLPAVGDSMVLQAGRFYTANGISTATNSGTATAGSLIAGTPIFIPNAVMLQTLSCSTAGTITGTAHIRLALYNDAGGVPGVPVTGADSGDMSQTTAGVLTSGTLGVALAPGWYWPVFESSGLAGATIWFANGARANAQGGTTGPAFSIISAFFSKLMTHTYGAALPTWVTTSESSTTDMPVIALGL